MDVKEAMEEQMEMQEVYKWVAKKLDGELDRNQEDRVDVVLEELMDEGAAVLGDGRPSEYTFKIHGEKTNVTIVIIIAPYLVL